MKVFHYLPIVAITLSSVGCGNQSTKESVQYDMNNLDTSVKAGDDFYQFATGGWQKSNPLTDQYSRYGAFEKLDKVNQEQIKGLIEDLGKSENADGSAAQKIGDLYSLGMDSAKLNAEGIEPLKEQLALINGMKSTSDVAKVMGEISQYANNPFFGFYVGSDMKDSNSNIVNIGQSGLGLGDRDYYLNSDSTTLAIIDGYKELIRTQFVNAGYVSADADKAVEVILKIESALAKEHTTKESRRQPELNYNKINYSDLNKTLGNFDWDAYFKASHAKEFDAVDVGQTSGIKEGVRLINTLPVDDIKIYFSWCLINSAASYLSDNFIKANFDFYGKQLTGKKEIQPRWKRVVNTVNGALSEAVGQIYVEKYFPAEAKTRMLELVKNLQTTLGERINKLTWMSAETKIKAQEKLSTFHVKIGYPDKWKDYSTLKVEKDSYWANIVRAKIFSHKEMINKINTKVDREEWLMPPQMINAYYNPTTNEICFPAAILQPPFFYLDGDDAVNYGAIGVVIGHEMSHGFDDQGCMFDKDGNLKNWWTEDDKKQFDERAKVLVNHFDNIEVLPGLNGNGKFTLGENIGDFGGLQIAYNAFEKTEQAKDGKEIEGYTPQQRFFFSYAGVWAAHIREAEIRRRTQTDPHSLGEWRVNGTLPHINAWYKAFDIKEGDKLYLPENERADIW